MFRGEAYYACPSSTSSRDDCLVYEAFLMIIARVEGSTSNVACIPRLCAALCSMEECIHPSGEQV